MATQRSRDDSGDDSDAPSGRVSSRWERVVGWSGSRWSRFNAWRTTRPFMGGILLCLAGIVISWVPMQILPDLIFIGGQMTGFLAIGALLGVGVFLSGAFALTKPAYSDTIGVIGVVMSILSLFGSLGGLFLGMLLGILGGNLCVAWRPRDEAAVDDAVTEPSTVDRAAGRLRAGIKRVVGKSLAHLRNGTEYVRRRGVDE